MIDSNIIKSLKNSVILNADLVKSELNGLYADLENMYWASDAGEEYMHIANNFADELRKYLCEIEIALSGLDNHLSAVKNAEENEEKQKIDDENRATGKNKQ